MKVFRYTATSLVIAAVGCGDGADTTAGTSAQGVVAGQAAGVAGQSAGAAGRAGGAAATMMPGLGTMMMNPMGGSAGGPPMRTATGASGAMASAGGGGHAGAVAATTGSAGQAGAAVAGAAGAHAGAAGAAGSGMAGSAGAGATSSASDPMDPTSVCMGGKPGMDSEAVMTRAMTSSRNFSLVYLTVPAPNKIKRFQTILPVPKVPSAKSTLFIWPGLQHSGGADPARLGNGVLQPVLTWGPSCNPKAPGKGNDYKGWWISGMYVNVSTGAAGAGGCAGGEAMDVGVGDRLYIDFAVQGTEWTQTVLNFANMKKVDFKFDMKGQDQNWAIWDIETPGSSRPAEDTFFEKSVLTFESPVTTCQPTSAPEVDYFSAPILSADGLNCCYEKMILKAKR